MIIHHKISIQASRAIIFDYIFNTKKVSSWIPELTEIQYYNDFNEHNAIGTKFLQRVTNLNKNTEQNGEIIAFKQDDIFGVEILHKPFKVKVFYELDNQDGSKEILLTYKAELHFKNWYYKILGNFLIWRAKKQIREQLTRLKLLSEAQEKNKND